MVVDNYDRYQSDTQSRLVATDGVSYLDVCGILRASTEMNDCAIVMLTARGEAQNKAEAFTVGADDCIVKPVSSGDSVARVRTAIQRRVESVAHQD